MMSTPLFDQVAGICKVFFKHVADGVDIADGKFKEGPTLGICKQGVCGGADAAACKQTAACVNQEEVRTKVCRLEVKLEDDVLCMVGHVDSKALSNLQKAPSPTVLCSTFYRCSKGSKKKSSALVAFGHRVDNTCMM